MKPQLTTTADQSKRLLACGVDPRTADMSVRTIKEPHGDNMAWHTPKLLTLPYDEAVTIYGKDEIEPAWSLSMLISLIPMSIDKYNIRFSLRLESCPDGDDSHIWRIGYHSEAWKTTACYRKAPTPIEACVRMIEWLVENKHPLNKFEE